jgi:hypothetical protein
MQTVVVRIHPPQPFSIFYTLENQVGEISGRATSEIEALSRFDRVAFRTESLLSKDVMYDTVGDIADMWTI